MKELLLYMAKNLVDHPESVTVTEIDGEDGKYRSKGKPVTAARLGESITFTAPWGEEMRIRAGGYLIISNPADVYGIAEDEFCKTYVKAKG